MEICSICQDDITEDRAQIACDHCFHSKCLAPWQKQTNSCPNCRKPIDPKEKTRFLTSDDLNADNEDTAVGAFGNSAGHSDQGDDAVDAEILIYEISNLIHSQRYNLNYSRDAEILHHLMIELFRFVSLERSQPS
jgi:hypothetical protein